MTSLADHISTVVPWLAALVGGVLVTWFTVGLGASLPKFGQAGRFFRYRWLECLRRRLTKWITFSPFI
jgi:hypothetical protein